MRRYLLMPLTDRAQCKLPAVLRCQPAVAFLIHTDEGSWYVQTPSCRAEDDEERECAACT